MITETRYAYPPSVIDHSSKKPADGQYGEASPFAKVMDQSRQEQPPSEAGPMEATDAVEGGGIPRITDFDDVMNWTVRPAVGLGDFVTAMSPEAAESFMAAAQSDEVPPAPIGIDLDETVLDPEILNNHEGETYNFITRKWSSEE